VTGSVRRIVITPGEPAGIGPDVTLLIAQFAWPAELIVIADPDLLRQRAELLGLPLQLEPVNWQKPAQPQQPGTLKILPVQLAAPAQAGSLNVDNAAYVMATLEAAALACLEKKADAMVTGPVHKGIINEAQIPFQGHTEFLAAFCKVPQAIMLFVLEKLKVALLTTHIPLSEVPRQITQEKLLGTIRLLHQELQTRFSVAHPHILVCGVNPHAGEGGHFGREEIDIMLPAIQQLHTENIHVTGPLPADTIFIRPLANNEVILAMYHDQALPVVKYAGFDKAVNVTLGLPIIRTSVDHGTALDIAGSGKADAGSLKAALELALRLVTLRKAPRNG
jgi:4-hydroxythreonine-4-phosphate dehydrogenase